MGRRTKDWEKGLAKDLKNPEFAREFLLAAVEEGVSLQQALGKAIRSMGVKEFADKIEMKSPNLYFLITSDIMPSRFNARSKMGAITRIGFSK